jgi:hypothetical protein
MCPLLLEAFASLEVWPLGDDGSVLLSVVAQALLCNFLCAVSSSSLLSGDADDGCQWKSRLLSVGFVLNPVAGVELPKEAFTSRAR